jgi:predicted acyl esterase
MLRLYGSSSRDDADFFIKLSEQMPQSAEDRAKGHNPPYYWITKGWLRASHRALDPTKSIEMEPYHTHLNPQAIERGKIYRFDISLEPMAHRFRKGNRVRIEIVNGDSAVTDVVWTHYYLPGKIGTDTIYHSADYPSALVMPVIEGA